MTSDNALVLHPQPRLEAVLETILQAEAHLHASSVPLVERYHFTAAIEALLHERIVLGLKDVRNAHFEIRLACARARATCQILDNGKAPQVDTDSGTLAQALKKADMQIALTQEQGLNCLALTLDTRQVAAKMRTTLAR